MKCHDKTRIDTGNHKHHGEVSCSGVSCGSGKDIGEHGETERNCDVEETLSSSIWKTLDCEAKMAEGVLPACQELRKVVITAST